MNDMRDMATAVVERVLHFVLPFVMLDLDSVPLFDSNDFK